MEKPMNVVSLLFGSADARRNWDGMGALTNVT
jgi:hypothetical protein